MIGSGCVRRTDAIHYKSISVKRGARLNYHVTPNLQLLNRTDDVLIGKHFEEPTPIHLSQPAIRRGALIIITRY